MEEISPVRYQQGEVLDVENEISYQEKQTKNQGINDQSTISFRFEAHPHDFTNLRASQYEFIGELRNLDNTPAIDLANKNIFLDPQGMHSMMSDVGVALNDNMNGPLHNYPYAVALARAIGTNMKIRDAVWAELDGAYNPGNQKTSTIDGNNMSSQFRHAARRLKTMFRFRGRIFSDLLMSARQYMPPGVALTITLKRAPDTFSLVTNSKATCSRYKIYLHTVSVFIEQIPLAPRVHANPHPAGITYNKLDMRMATIPRGQNIFPWLNCLNNAELPNRLYMVMVANTSMTGDLGKMATYFETGKLTRLNFRLNGRDLMVQPIQVKFWDSALVEGIDTVTSDGREGYLTIVQVLNQVCDPLSVLRLGYKEWLQGRTIYALEFGKCGQKTGERGCVDMLMEFDEGGVPVEMCVLLFMEKTATAPI